MSEFSTYFWLGITHITDPEGYDHILFIVALTAVYLLKDWRQVFILVTAFTLGHSVTLALATLNLVSVSSAWVEFLIPLSIFITCFFNYFKHFKTHQGQKDRSLTRYLVAIFFGLIHGLGFSNFLKALLGSETSIFQPLLAFNLGLEIGQIAIVLASLLLTAIFVSFLKVKRREWMLLLSGAAGGISFLMMLERLPF